MQEQNPQPQKKDDPKGFLAESMEHPKETRILNLLIAIMLSPLVVGIIIYLALIAMR